MNFEIQNCILRNIKYLCIDVSKKGPEFFMVTVKYILIKEQPEH